MPTQDFNIYTARGYAGELVDSGPRVVQTGILVGSDLAFGLAVERDNSVNRGIAGGTSATLTDVVNVYAISQREYNHEAATRPSDGSVSYLATESVSIIRQGYLYVTVDASTNAVVAGTAVNINQDGTFTTDTAASGTIYATSNVILDEDFAATGDILVKVRIDIVA